MEVAITNTQQGVITEAEFAKIAILTSNGRLVPTRALADDDRRDFEIHIRRHFRESLAVQVKTAKQLRLHGRSRVFQINFRVKAPLVSDEHLYYFLAHFDIKARGYTDPLFFIPSPFFHKHALHVVGRGTIQLQFKASMEANAKGMWTPFAVPQARAGHAHPRDPELRRLRSARAGSSRGAAHRLAGCRLATTADASFRFKA